MHFKVLVTILKIRSKMSFKSWFTFCMDFHFNLQEILCAYLKFGKQTFYKCRFRSEDVDWAFILLLQSLFGLRNWHLSDGMVFKMCGSQFDKSLVHTLQLLMSLTTLCNQCIFYSFFSEDVWLCRMVFNDAREIFETAR